MPLVKYETEEGTVEREISDLRRKDECLAFPVEKDGETVIRMVPFSRVYHIDVNDEDVENQTSFIVSSH